MGGSIDKPAFFGAHYRVVPPPLGSSSSAAAGGAGAAPDRLAAFSFGEAGNDALLTMWEYDTNFKCVRAWLPPWQLPRAHGIGCGRGGAPIGRVGTMDARAGVSRRCYVWCARGV